MSAWHKLAALGLLAPLLATASCTVSEGDDDENAGTGGTSASGGTGGKAGTGGTGGATGGTSGTGGSTGGTGGSTGGTGGTGGTTIMCDPAAAAGNACQECIEGTACCDLFEACANDAICGYNEAQLNDTRCIDGCKQAICLPRAGMETGTCDATLLAMHVSAADEMVCTDYCRPGGTPSSGEFMCAVGCLQAAKVVLEGARPPETATACSSACMSPDSGLGTLTGDTSDLIDCVIENCSACDIGP